MQGMMPIPKAAEVWPRPPLLGSHAAQAAPLWDHLLASAALSPAATTC